MQKIIIDHKRLEIYQLSQQFVLEVYKIVENFPSKESNNLTSQLCRASSGIPLNIAEGASAGSYRIFLNYLFFAYRSARELEAALELCKMLKYIDESQHAEIFEKLDEMTRKIYRYTEYIDEKAGDSKRSKTYFYKQQKYYADNDTAKS